MPKAVIIAVILIDPSIEEKINKKHDLTAAEVREAFVHRTDVQLYWEDHPVHGRRLIGLGATAGGRRVFAVFLPVQADIEVWILKTARAGDW